MELRPFRALRGNPVFKERRPGLWIDRQILEKDGEPFVLPFLLGIVRLSREAGLDVVEDPSLHDAVARRVGALVSAKADGDPCLLITRAPLADSLSTTRRPDLIWKDERGVEHSLVRINDYAQHVELQGLLKNAQAEIGAGQDLWEAGRQFALSPPAQKMPGARYKLCAIVDERQRAMAPSAPEAPRGLLAFSFEDPVY